MARFPSWPIFFAALALLSAAAPAPSFQQQNGLDAQKLNAQFATLKASDACIAGQQACVDQAFAQCVGGKWALTPCASGTICVVLPLVNAPGMSLSCDTQADAVARMQAAGVDPSLTGNGNVTDLPTVSASSSSDDDTDCMNGGHYSVTTPTSIALTTNAPQSSSAAVSDVRAANDAAATTILLNKRQSFHPFNMALQHLNTGKRFADRAAGLMKRQAVPQTVTLASGPTVILGSIIELTPGPAPTSPPAPVRPSSPVPTPQPTTLSAALPGDFNPSVVTVTAVSTITVVVPFSPTPVAAAPTIITLTPANQAPSTPPVISIPQGLLSTSLAVPVTTSTFIGIPPSNTPVFAPTVASPATGGFSFSSPAANTPSLGSFTQDSASTASPVFVPPAVATTVASSSTRRSIFPPILQTTTASTTTTPSPTITPTIAPLDPVIPTNSDDFLHLLTATI